MYEPLKLFWGTVLLRPYVFTFLAAYIVAGWRHVGWKRTLVYIPVGYTLAWISEFSSIHWGFPYGDYFYIQSTAQRELWVFGVPFMDSLSYVFLSYCSYSLAVFLLSPLAIRSANLVVLETRRIRQSWQTLILGAFLFVLLDVVIDPVALLGQKWFLGKIYGYRYEGLYFGIPMSNFGGWLLVGVVLTAALQALDRMPSLDSKPPPSPSWMRMFGPALYFSVLIFNIVITLSIGEMLLGTADLILFSGLLAGMVFFTIQKNSIVFPEDVDGYLLQHSSTAGDSPSIALDSHFPRHPGEHRGRDPQKSGD